MMYFFFFNDTATTEIYTLSLHDALPIYGVRVGGGGHVLPVVAAIPAGPQLAAFGPGVHHLGITRVKREDRKSTRLNSSHANISYAVFCLKKKKKTIQVYFTLYDSQCIST